MSAAPDTCFERRFRGRLSDLDRVTAEAIEYVEAAGVEAQAVYSTRLTIEEMVTNILKYGFDDTAVHEIHLRLEILPGAVRIILEDDGHPFNPLAAPEPDVNQPADQRVPGGLGIHLVRKLVDQIHYERREGRNRLTVQIRF